MFFNMLNMNDYSMFKRCFFSPPSLQQPCCLDTITTPKQCSGEWKNNPKVVKQELLDQTTHLLAQCVTIPAILHVILPWPCPTDFFSSFSFSLFFVLIMYCGLAQSLFLEDTKG